MTDGADTELILRRSYPHSRDRVFDAFANPGALEQWFSPAPDIPTKVIDFDFRLGGRYRIGFTLPDGIRNSVSGEFTRIERPTQLCFTWCWDKPDPHAGVNTLVTINFVDNDGATEIVVIHKMEDAEMRSRHSVGWLGALERLQGWLAPRTAATD